MSLLWVQASADSLHGVLHGMDDEGGHYEAPYKAADQRQILDHMQRMREKYPQVRWSEASHPGNCDESGCKFYEHWQRGRQAYTAPDGRNAGGYSMDTSGERENPV